MDGSIISYTIGYLFFSIVFTILSIKVLKDRGYGADKFVFWGLASFIFGIFGFLLCLGMPNLVKKKQQEEMCDAVVKSANSQSAADELKKIKELYDSGVLNQYEYEAKRNELIKKL